MFDGVLPLAGLHGCPTVYGDDDQPVGRFPSLKSNSVTLFSLGI